MSQFQFDEWLDYLKYVQLDSKDTSRIFQICQMKI